MDDACLCAVVCDHRNEASSLALRGNRPEDDITPSPGCCWTLAVVVLEIHIRRVRANRVDTQGHYLAVPSMPKPVEDGIQRVIAYERDFVPVKLVQKQQLTASTSLFVFELPEKAELLMFSGHHVTLRRVTKHKQVICRPYTPVTELVRCFGGKDSNNVTMQSLNAAGTVAIATKKYKDGAMSEWLHVSLRIGDTVDLMGPSGGFYYSPNQHATINLIAGGTGITPILSVILAVLKNHSDSPTMKLVYVNSMEQDVMFRDELDTLEQLYPNKLSEVNLKGSGCITREVLSTNLPGPSDQHLVVIYGPTGFCTTVQTTLAKLKYEEHTLFTFGETDK